MSMMMKLINAAAGQSVGDEIYFVNMTTNTFQLAKFDFDAGTLTYGPNKSDGTYGDPNPGGNNAQPDNLSHYSYSSQSNGSSFVGDDGYLYSIGQTSLSNQYSSAVGKTGILMRWNLRTLTPDPGFFYNVLYRNDSNAYQYPQTLFYHTPTKTITVIGWVEYVGNHAHAHTFKVDPWPSTPIDAMGSGIYHSTSNPNGRHMGTFLRPESNEGDHDALHISGLNQSAGQQRLQVFSNGKDQIGISTMYGSNSASSDSMSFKRAYVAPYGVSYSPEVYNVGSGNFQFETTSSENPFLEMTGSPIPGDDWSRKTWKSHNNNGSTNYGIVNVWYRPGRDNAGIHKTPGIYYVQSRDASFYTFTEGSTKTEQYHSFDDVGTYSYGHKYTLLDNGLIVRGYNSGQNPSNGYTPMGIKVMDIDNRVRGVVPGSYTVHGDYYDQSFQHTPSDPQSEYIPLSKNPNNKYIEKVVQTKSGRTFGVLYAENASELPPNGGTRIIEIFISDPDPNNFGRRSVSYGDSKIFSGSQVATSGSQSATLVGNMPTAKISTANATAAVKTRFSDTGNAFIQDTPTDAIYIRENTHLYAINPNTRSNITSYDFANQGVSGYTNATNIDPSTDNLPSNARPQWNGELGRSPTGRFVEGENATTTFDSHSNTGYGDVEGNTTYDLIYGDDTRLYMALKMNVEHYPTSSYGGQYGYQDIDGTHCLIRFHTGKDGTTIVCGEHGPHPNEYANLRVHPNGTRTSAASFANYLAYGQREYYYFGLLNNHSMSSMNHHGPRASDIQGGNGGMFSGVNLMYDNKRNNVWVVGRRDHQNCNNPDGRTNYSKMIAVPVGDIGADLMQANYQSWPGTRSSYINSEPILANLTAPSALYGQTGNINTSQAQNTFLNDGANAGYDKIWMNSANYSNSDTPNGFEMRGIISGQAINVTMNGKTDTYNDAYDPTTKNKGSQLYFSGMTNDPRPYSTGSQTHPPQINRSSTSYVSPLGENRIGAVPFKHQSYTGYNSHGINEPGYKNSNRNHNPSLTTLQNSNTSVHQHLYHARIKLKTNQTTSITTDNNEEGIRCVWYYKGAFHGVTTYNDGTYVYMPEPEHGYNNEGNTPSPNDNINTVTHYVSQCESGQNTYNNRIYAYNVRVGTAEGCKNADWAACVAPGGILCIPKQDSGYAKAGFIGVNLGTRDILNRSGAPLEQGLPFEAPSSLNPNGRQIKQMVVTSTGKIWALLDYENPSASTLQFRILQVVFNSNYSSVTWSGGLYTSQASNANSGHVKFYRTVCGNMPQSKMEWDAV